MHSKEIFLQLIPADLTACDTHCIKAYTRLVKGIAKEEYENYDHFRLATNFNALIVIAILFSRWYCTANI